MEERPRQLPKIIVIAGPTATGKSDLAVKLARDYNGEVISADSRQVYRGLTIGSGKITKREMKGVPHHLLDVASPKRVFTAADFKRLGEKAIAGILARGKLPIIAGGTGFYIQALVDGLTLPEVSPNKALRTRLEKKPASELLARLEKLDPARFSVLVHSASGQAENKRRLIRAIEVATALGKVLKLKKPAPKYDALFIGLDLPDEKLREKIKTRLLARMKKGMLAEVKKLHKHGVAWKRLEALGLEYRYLSRFLQNKLSKREMLEELETKIWQYAKRQRTWFRRDRRIKWFAPSDLRKTKTFVKKFLD